MTRERMDSIYKQHTENNMVDVDGVFNQIMEELETEERRRTSSENLTHHPQCTPRDMFAKDAPGVPDWFVVGKIPDFPVPPPELEKQVRQCDDYGKGEFSSNFTEDSGMWCVNLKKSAIEFEEKYATYRAAYLAWEDQNRCEKILIAWRWYYADAMLAAREATK